MTSNFESSCDDNAPGLNVLPVKLWCYCRKPDDFSEVMIAYDYPRCPIYCFHKSCLRLRSFSKKWYCPNCRKIQGKHPLKLEKMNNNKAYRK